MDGRRWGDGLHQSIEAKEGLEVQPETETIASITYQSLFRRFKTLASMSGTALTEAEEMATIYDLRVVAVPPVLPAQRVDLPNGVFKNVKGKSMAALDELLGMHKAGRPVLVGTTSVEASQAFSDKLKTLGVTLDSEQKKKIRDHFHVISAGRPHGAGSIGGSPGTPRRSRRARTWAPTTTSAPTATTAVGGRRSRSR